MDRVLIAAVLAVSLAAPVAAATAQASASAAILAAERLPIVAAARADLAAGQDSRVRQFTAAERDDEPRRTWPVIIEFE
jgi:hypothetical protein